jgi:hypothetical protein
MMNGALEFLVSDAREARLLRRHYVFKIVPMLNPDGVRYGNYRTSLLGVDLNRRWDSPHKTLHPTIFYTKRLIQSFSEDREVMACVDMHGHSMKKDVFVYGCCVKSREYEGRKVNVMIKMLPFLLAEQNSCFSFKDCKFRLEKSKETTQRIVLFRELGLLNAYTIEASFYGPSHQAALEDRKPRAGEEPIAAHFETYHLEKVGRDLCKQFLAYVSPVVFRRKLEYVGRALKNRLVTAKKTANEATSSKEHLEQEPSQLEPHEDFLGLIEDYEETEGSNMTNLLGEIGSDFIDNLGELGGFDAESDSGGSDSCPSEPEQASPELQSRPKSQVRIKTRATKPLKQSGSLLKQNVLKVRSLGDRRKETMTASPQAYTRKRLNAADEAPPSSVIKQATPLRLTLQQHFDHMSKIRSLISKNKPRPAGLRSRPILVPDPHELSLQDSALRIGNMPPIRNVIQIPLKTQPNESNEVPSFGTGKSRPVVIWKSPAGVQSFDGTII